VKFVLLIGLFIFVCQTDTTKKDSIDTYELEQKANIINYRLDSIIAVIKQDTIK
jgi:thioredoxin-related protein